MVAPLGHRMIAVTVPLTKCVRNSPEAIVDAASGRVISRCPIGSRGCGRQPHACFQHTCNNCIEPAAQVGTLSKRPLPVNPRVLLDRRSQTSDRPMSSRSVLLLVALKRKSPPTRPDPKNGLSSHVVHGPPIVVLMQIRRLGASSLRMYLDRRD